MQEKFLVFKWAISNEKTDQTDMLNKYIYIYTHTHIYLYIDTTRTH